jgi:hypothetical protein
VWIFFIFRSSNIRDSPTCVISFVSPPQCRLRWPTSPCHRVVQHFLPMEPRQACCLRFILRQRFILPPPLSSRNRSIEFAPLSLATLSDCLTPTLHCYKKVISTFVTLTITQPCLNFASSLARAPRHWSSTHRRHSLSPSSYTHFPSAQWHPRWWTSRPFFASRTTYRHVDSRKKIF